MVSCSDTDQRSRKKEIPPKGNCHALQNRRHCNNCCGLYQLPYFIIPMKTIYNIAALVVLCLYTMVCGCNNSSRSDHTQQDSTLSNAQRSLLEEGWYIPKTTPLGELSKEYGVKNKYGQQDNYFDIEIGNGCDVAIKIVDVATDKCIRYVFVPENSSANIQMIPQGKYYLKLAYGKDWMEYENGDGTLVGKFTSNVTYDRSVDIFDFGRKNSTNVVNYLLQINVVDSQLQNSFGTIEISEAEFMN